MRYINSRLTLR